MVFNKKVYMKEYRQTHKEENKEYHKEYRENNKDKITKYREDNREKGREYNKTYREDNREKESQRGKEYRLKNKEKISNQNKDYYQKHKRERKEYIKEYFQRLEVIEHRNIYYRGYNKQRWLSDVDYRITHLLRVALLGALKQYSQTGKQYSSKKYGIDFTAIINHLKPFPEDIENYHIDHIIPLSLFDFNNPEHIKKAFMPHNHQFLTIKQNLEKGNKLVMPQAFK